MTAIRFAVSAVLDAARLAAKGRMAELRQGPLAWLHGVGGLSGAWVTPGPAAWAVMVALGKVSVGAFFLWDVDMKRGDPRLLGTLAFAAPVLSTLLLAAAGLAPFTATTVLASVLVAGGGYVAAQGVRLTAPAPGTVPD